MFVGSPRETTRGRPGGWTWFRGNGDRLARLGKVFLVGVPLWCAIGIVITFSPEIAASMHVRGPIDAGKAVLVSYLGASLGSLLSGALSQALRSRRTAILVFLDLTALVTGAFLLLDGVSTGVFYAACALLGLGVGYWAVFVQVAAEQFGTDLRATVATAAPNLVRGSVLLFVPAYTFLGPRLGLAASAVLLMACTLAMSLAATWRLRETYGIELDYTESVPTSTTVNEAEPTFVRLPT